MLRFIDFQEASIIQCTIFTPGFNFVTHKILIDLLEIRPDIFDGEPLVLPLPPDAPSEMPRITLQNQRGSLKLEVAPARINFFRIKIDESDVIAINDFILSASDFLRSYLDKTGSQCGRIAAVLKRYSFNENPSLAIASHFCKDIFLEAPFNRPASFEIHARKRYIFLNQFEINSWVRIKSGIIKFPSGEPSSIVLVEQDINTLYELIETRNYSQDEIENFFNNILNEFNNILSLYFN